MKSKTCLFFGTFSSTVRNDNIEQGGTLDEAVSRLQFVSSKHRSLAIVHGFNGKGNNMFVS